MAEHIPTVTEGVDRQRLAALFAPLSVGEITARFDFTPSPITGMASDWQRFCQLREGRIFEYPTREYVTALATYFAGRCAVVSARTGERPRILEVAAGQGRLAFLLASAFEDMGVGASVAAVDNRNWPGVRWESCVTNMDFRDAIAKYEPHLILGAWLPGEARGPRGGRLPWAQTFQEAPATQEYVLAGPLNRHADDAAWDDSHIAAGFERVDLTGMRQLQIAWTSVEGNMHPSSSVAFRRLSG